MRGKYIGILSFINATAFIRNEMGNFLNSDWFSPKFACSPTKHRKFTFNSRNFQFEGFFPIRAFEKLSILGSSGKFGQARAQRNISRY